MTEALGKVLRIKERLPQVAAKDPHYLVAAHDARNMALSAAAVLPHRAHAQGVARLVHPRGLPRTQRRGVAQVGQRRAGRRRDAHLDRRRARSRLPVPADRLREELRPMAATMERRPRPLTAEEQAKPYAKYYTMDLGAPDPGRRSSCCVATAGLDPRRRCSCCRGHQPAARPGQPRGRDRLVHAGQRRRPRRRAPCVPGVHRRDDRLVVRLACSRGSALPHLVSRRTTSASPRSTTGRAAGLLDPNVPGGRSAPRDHYVTEDTAMRHEYIDINFLDPERHGLRHEPVEGAERRHVRRRLGVSAERQQPPEIDRRAGDHGATSAARSRAASSTAPASGWATRINERQARVHAAAGRRVPERRRVGLANHNVHEYRRGSSPAALRWVVRASFGGTFA